MTARAASRRGPARQRGPVRTGRPPRELAGEVEERILDAAAAVFIERGFEGASVDEIAEVARAGKPTIYARFPGKEALFTAVVARLVRRNTATMESVAAKGATIEERLAYLGTSLLRNMLVPETVGLLRAAIAEARRFPELATSASRMGRERATEAAARALGELAQSEKAPPPAFAADRLPKTARRFLDMVLLPMLMRALLGENPGELNAEIGPHVSQTVAFFLAACKEADDG
jgi:AcrR family transcriptional regulator